MQWVNYQIVLHPPHENRKIERRVRKIHQQISGEVGNLEIMKNSTNKMRDMSKRPKGNPKFPRGAQLPLL